MSDSKTNRRQFVANIGNGLAGIALASLLQRDGGMSIAAESSAASRFATPDGLSHFAPKAKSVIWLFMNGGVSHMESFDPKPELDKVDGQLFKRENVKTNQVKGNRYFVRSPFKFQQYGHSGLHVSELFQETAAHADDLAFSPNPQ